MYDLALGLNLLRQSTDSPGIRSEDVWLEVGTLKQLPRLMGRRCGMPLVQRHIR